MTNLSRSARVLLLQHDRGEETVFLADQRLNYSGSGARLSSRMGSDNETITAISMSKLQVKDEVAEKRLLPFER